MLEAAQHDDNTFATLTYDDDHCPGDNSLSPRELSLFIKRLRKSLPHPVRYFACGEYGERTARPHYHLAIFGMASCQHGITREKAICCSRCKLISDTWGLGKIFLGTLEQNSSAYIAGYVAKKYTPLQNYEHRVAPFVRMSLRPGIGLGMMHELASTLLQHKLDEKMIDVPIALQHGTHQWPLGRYLRRKLRTFIGRQPNAPPEVLTLQAEELQTLRETAWTNQTSLKTEILDRSLGKRIQIDAKHRRQKRETA